jgi:hypothetical protein
MEMVQFYTSGSLPPRPPGEEQADGQGKKAQDGDDQPVGQGHDRTSFQGKNYQFQGRMSKTRPCITVIPVDFGRDFRYYL